MIDDPALLGDSAHQAWLGGLTDRMLEFYRAAADIRLGGFRDLDAEGRPIDRPRLLYNTARMTFSYSLGAALGHPGSDELVAHGLRALATYRDRRDGGWFPAMAADSQSPTMTDKQTYAHAFVVLAASTATELDVPGAAAMLDEALDIFERRLWDEDAGMCVDTWDRGWRQCEPYRGVNPNMHTVEAMLAAYSATGRTELLARAERICTRVAASARSSEWRLVEHFDTDWQPLPDYNRERPDDPFRPFGYTPGHGVEWARLMLQVRLALDERRDDRLRGDLVEAARGLFGRAVADGWDRSRFGFAYTVDWSGREVSAHRLHWPLTEAIAAARFLYAATAEAEYAEWYAEFWQLAAASYIDPRTGTWAHELDPDGRPATSVWSGRPDLYHALQAIVLSRLAPTAAPIAALRDIRSEPQSLRRRDTPKRAAPS